MKRRILATCFLIFVLCYGMTAFALTMDEVDIYNNLYYPQSIYNGGINSSPQDSKQDVCVNTATGSTRVRVNDFTLPGVNGFDLNISRTYDSTNASLFEAYLGEKSVPYQVEYFMIKGNKRESIYYTNGDWHEGTLHNICLTPDFMTYIETKTDNWMADNKSSYGKTTI